MKTPAFLALVILCFAAGAFGQGRPAWIAKLDETIKLKERSWKPGQRLVNDQGASYTEGITLANGGVRGLIQITSYSILENPEETFEGHVIARDNMNKKGKKVKLAGLGDEGYVWPGRSATDFAEILFRKGSTFVTVFLPGRATAERFARHVAAHIP
ncbi:MAG TPA: hypothetical protein VMZ26_17460 [Pyrinomonadaceae bacterium]|nr:hypothetical protein [Pyrinomonadaceae bacterium]